MSAANESLRESCPNGCGAKILPKGMSRHARGCPNAPKPVEPPSLESRLRERITAQRAAVLERLEAAGIDDTDALDLNLAVRLFIGSVDLLLGLEASGAAA